MMGQIEFEADSPDEALLKLGMYFIAQMESRLMYVEVENGVKKVSDPLQSLFDNFEVIDRQNSLGGITVTAKEVFMSPGMLQ
jgi:hypothetical protein